MCCRVMQSCVKIGEGVYGEVFRALTPEPVAFKVCKGIWSHYCRIFMFSVLFTCTCK